MAFSSTVPMYQILGIRGFNLEIKTAPSGTSVLLLGRVKLEVRHKPPN